MLISVDFWKSMHGLAMDSRNPTAVAYLRPSWLESKKEWIAKVEDPPLQTGWTFSWTSPITEFLFWDSNKVHSSEIGDTFRSQTTLAWLRSSPLINNAKRHFIFDEEIMGWAVSALLIPSTRVLFSKLPAQKTCSLFRYDPMRCSSLCALVCCSGMYCFKSYDFRKMNLCARWEFHAANTFPKYNNRDNNYAIKK